MKHKFNPPTVLNLAIATVVISGMCLLQFLSSHTKSLSLFTLYALGFALLILPLNGLIHEAEHRMLCRHHKLNEYTGRLISAFFPSSLYFTRHTHLGHHKRNRSDDELFDQYYPEESRWFKSLSFYSLYLGLFWIVIPLGSLAVAVLPSSLWQVMGGQSGQAMVARLPHHLIKKIRVDGLLILLVHSGMISLLDLSFSSWLILYLLAGLLWSSQQGLVHAGTKRHVIEGARDLNLPFPFQALFLSWNLHLTHHRHPSVPWLYLDQIATPKTERSPYFETNVRFWRGPTLCVEPPPRTQET